VGGPSAKNSDNGGSATNDEGGTRRGHGGQGEPESGPGQGLPWDAFIASVSTSLKAGKEVRLVGFGSFVPIKRPAGTARNPRTGETVRRKASATCRFKGGRYAEDRAQPLRRR